ncbi:MAG: tetratricopeptide repeat protein [Caldilineaceae bacterium]
MPRAQALSILVDLRKSAGLSQEKAAIYCGLSEGQGRKSFSAWELGETTPNVRHRTKFFGYLWYQLRLRDRPSEFERVWDTLVEEWGWEPIGDAEWTALTSTPRAAKQQLLSTDGKLDQILNALQPAEHARYIPMQKPPRTKNFTGRASELEKLLVNLQPGRVTALCGPGGIGKSALAAEAVWTLAPSDDPPELFPDGVLFHSFYHQPEANLAMESIALAYGIDPRPTPRDAARRALAGKRTLLVLDGAESAGGLDALLAVASECAVLITSRRCSDAPENFQTLQAMSVLESRELLRSWAGIYASQDVALDEIVQLVGGLPLALFLTGHYLARRCQDASDFAAWIRETGLQALHFADRPSKSIPLLMQHSLAQVSKSAQDVFRVAGALALAPFTSTIVGVALEISEANANHCLGELVDFGLLLRIDDGYQITHPLAHTYAREREAPDADAIRLLARAYAHWAKLASRDGIVGFAFLDRERSHIMAVLTMALSASQWEAAQELAWQVMDYLDMRGYSTDRLTVVQVGLAAARAEGNPRHESAFLNALGNTYISRGEINQAFSSYEKQMALAMEIGDDEDKAAALGSLALVYTALGEQSDAIKLLEQVLEIGRRMGDRVMVARSLGNLGLAHSQLGEFREALALHEQTLSIYRELDERRGIATSLGNVAMTYTALGDPCRALEFHNEQLTITQEIGDRRGESIALGNLGNAYSALGELHKAIELYKQQLAIAREICDREGEAYACSNLGAAYAHLGDNKEAADLLMQQLAISQEIGDREGQHRALMNLGIVMADVGYTYLAKELFLKCIALAREVCDRHGEALGCWNLGLVYAQEGDIGGAIDYMQVRVDYEREINHPDAEANARQIAELIGH